VLAACEAAYEENMQIIRIINETGSLLLAGERESTLSMLLQFANEESLYFTPFSALFSRLSMHSKRSVKSQNPRPHLNEEGEKYAEKKKAPQNLGIVWKNSLRVSEELDWIVSVHLNVLFLSLWRNSISSHLKQLRGEIFPVVL